MDSFDYLSKRQEREKTGISISALLASKFIQEILKEGAAKVVMSESTRYSADRVNDVCAIVFLESALLHTIDDSYFNLHAAALELLSVVYHFDKVHCEYLYKVWVDTIMKKYWKSRG
jgi:hypothetical protein